MIYEFESEDGTVIERDFPMGEAPPIVTENCVNYRRIWSRVACIVDGGAPDVPFASHSLPHAWPYAKNHEILPNGKKGRCIFNGQLEQKEAISAARKDGEPVVYNELWDE